MRTTLFVMHDVWIRGDSEMTCFHLFSSTTFDDAKKSSHFDVHHEQRGIAITLKGDQQSTKFLSGYEDTNC